MHKVMLVDDDYPTVEYLSEAIPWEHLGLQLIGLYENGLSAFEAAQKNMPDILITDIGMPKMDGMELTRRLKQINEHLQVAMISCHDEFSYAQQALKLHVQDYFLKETLNVEEIKAILMKCKEKLESTERRTKEYRTLQFKAQQQLDREIQTKWKQYLQGSSQQMETRLINDRYIPVLFLINQFYLAEKQYGSEDTLLFAIQNIVKDIQNASAFSFDWIHYEDNRGFLLFESTNSIKVDSYSQVRQLITKIQEELKRYLHIQTSFILGENVEKAALRNHCVQLLESVTEIFYLPLNSMVNWQKRSMFNRDQVPLNYYSSITEKLKKAVYQRDIQEVRNRMKELHAVCVEKNIDPEIVKECYLRMILDWRMKARGFKYVSTIQPSESIQENILRMNNLYELEDYFMQYVHLFLSDYRQTVTTNKDVLNACSYVSKHLDSKFSLEEVADYLYLNPSYFSRLFKKEVGMTFIDYVKQQKMERAKEWLEMSDTPVGAISEQLGYDNQSYFIKIFKQHTGYTPLEYRTKVLTGIGEA